jgi:hypothetical protein
MVTDHNASSCRIPLLLAVWAFTLSPLSAAERELIRDPRFQNGFRLIEPTPGKRVPYGLLPGFNQAPPVWDLDQWSSKFPLEATHREAASGGILRYANAAKAVTLGKAGTEAADLALAVKAAVEYGPRARTAGEPWVHLLAEQPLENPPALGEITAARLHVEARLQRSIKLDTPDYSPARHAAQFQIFFSVQNLNRQSAGYGRYLWFGIPIYDDRARIPPAFKARDFGGTGMFIFTPAGDAYTPQSAHDREWVTLDKDLLPLMREGLETAWQRGFLTESKSLADYRIAGTNLGWELPGTFEVELQVRNLSLKVVKKKEID